MGLKYSIMLFHVLKNVDLNKTIKKIDPIMGPKLGGGGGVSGGSAKSPNFPFFLKPSLNLTKFEEGFYPRAFQYVTIKY